MSIVVVGGQARKVGKTSVVCGIIRSMPEREWTAVKLTHHIREGQSEPVMLEEATGSGDSARFIEAGAKRAVLIRVQSGHNSEVRTTLESLLSTGGNFIIESVGVMEFLTPDLFLLVVDPSNHDFKDAARRFADRASAVLAHAGEFTWPGLELSSACRVFRIEQREYVTPEVLEFVRKGLAQNSQSDVRER